MESNFGQAAAKILPDRHCLFHHQPDHLDPSFISILTCTWNCPTFNDHPIIGLSVMLADSSCTDDDGLTLMPSYGYIFNVVELKTHYLSCHDSWFIVNDLLITMGVPFLIFGYPHTCKKRGIAGIYPCKFFWIFRKILGWEREINTAPKPSPEVATSKMEVAPS